MIRGCILVSCLCNSLAAAEPASAGEVLRLQGLFCNTEAQIDEALEHIAAGVSPRHAADLANYDALVCTYVDRIEYLIARPTVIGNQTLPFVKYRGALVGVAVGGNLRPVEPEAELYFLTPQEVIGAASETRT